VRTLLDARDVLDVAARAVPGHPWPRVCLALPFAFGGGWATEGAVAWRGGHPWGAGAHDIHVLGAAEALAALVGHLARPGDYLIADPHVLADGGWSVPARRWWLREIMPGATPHGGSRHLPHQVKWLAEHAAGEVAGLLDQANPGAAFRPGDPGAGRWCGVRAGGRLVAAACETWPGAGIAQLSSLAVHPSERRRGLGAAVTAFFVDEAFAYGAPSVILGVDHDNRSGRLLYDRLGFSAWPMASIEASGKSLR